MKKPQTRFWIDARGEKLELNKEKTIEYIIDNFEDEQVKTKIIEAIYPIVKEIRVLEQPHTIAICYNPDLISRGFIEYLFQQKGVKFERTEK